MAEKKEEPQKRTRKLSANKKTQTVRERSAEVKAEKPRRIRKTARKVALPLGAARKIGKKEYHLPLPDNKPGKILKKRVRIVPNFVYQAFQEVRQVTWPDRKTTLRLTSAVFIFAVVFASIVGLLDYGLGELFKILFVN